MKQLSAALVGQTTNATIEVCKKSVRTIFNFALLAITFFTFAVIGKAATFTVTNLNNSGAGSLRQAVLDANSAGTTDIINFDPNVFSNPGRDFITFTSEINITDSVTINGPTQRNIWLNGNNATRIFNVTAGNVTINNLTFWRGNVTNTGIGGCLQIDGVTNSVNLSNLTFFSCTANVGAAIHNNIATLVITNSTFSSNTAIGNNGRGGAISSNTGNRTVTIVSSTITNNSASNTGGGVYFFQGTFNTKNSIYANNTANSFPDIAATVTSQGYNLIENTNLLNINGSTVGNQLNVDPQLGVLTIYGNASAIPLQRTSPAIDAGDPTLANTSDQRRARRNTDGNNNGIAGVDIGAVERQRTSFDFDGEETADITVLRSSGTNSPLFWYYGSDAPSRPAPVEENLLSPTPNAFTGFQFGLEGDIAVPGDYDGDGKTDAAVFRPAQGTWYVNQTTNGFLGFNWGLAGDIPVPADYDGDGKADFAVVRSNVWYIYKSTQGYTGAIVLGNSTDKPVPADYDGDLKADTAVYGNGIWTINRSSGGQTATAFGLSTDIPVPADYDGDGIDNITVFRPSNGTWYILKQNGGFESIAFGLATDKLVPADYDGDGKIDIAVKRAAFGRSIWYMLLSRDGYTFTDFGLDTDISVVNSLIRQ